MKFDLKVLTLILGLIFITEFIAIFVQYKINRIYRGIGWWLAGTGTMALSSILMPLLVVPPLAFLAKVASPLLILSHLALYIGLTRFLDQREHRFLLGAGFGLFLVFYYYFILFHNDISGRAVVVSAAQGAVLFLTAHKLFFKGGRGFRFAAWFTGAAMAAHGGFLVLRIASTLSAPPILSYVDPPYIYVAAFIVPMATSILWTFGFILMVNQRLNEEVLEDKETYRSILNASPDDITITDLEGRITMVSPAAHRMFGLPGGLEPGMHILDFIVPGDHARARANLGLMFQELSHKPNEYRGVRADGTVFDIEVNSGLTRDLAGRPAKLVFVVRDISERRRAEAAKLELADKTRQLQKADSLGRMAGAIAHHFNNQLQAVMSNLDLMPGADQDPRVARTRQAVDRAAAMSRLMLVYLGQTPAAREPRALADICRAALPGIRASLPATAALAAELPDPGPVVHAAAGQIQEALGNLVTNAWEAMDGAPGTIRLGLVTCLAADIPAAHRFPINWEPQAPAYACLSVADSGCGIGPAELENLFDPFYSTRFTGRGLGLPVVMGIVQAHGGAVVVRSEPGRGSVFQAYFPEWSQ